MPLTSIVLQVDNSHSFPARLKLAVDLAARHEARLLGLYERAHGQARVDDGTPPELRGLTQEREWLNRLDVQARASFEEAAQGQNVEHDWSMVADHLLDAMREHAAYADLVIAGQQEPEAAGRSGRDLGEAMLLESGRPILIVPFTGAPHAMGERVMVAWNPAPAANRAVRDAIPILQHARQVDVLVIDARPDRLDHATQASERLCQYLARHGIKATAHHAVGRTIGVGEQLLSRAVDWSSDLIVMGGYDHSRIRERVLGGATRTILSQMTVPVLMSH